MDSIPKLDYDTNKEKDANLHKLFRIFPNPLVLMLNQRAQP